MTTVQQHLDYSSLSFAAYAEDLLTKDIKTQYVRAGFTQSQARVDTVLVVKLN